VHTEDDVSTNWRVGPGADHIEIPEPETHTWVVVLAGGDGTRLARLTTDEQGQCVPKQFCSFNGGETLLQEALRRGRRITMAHRVCSVLSQRHAPLWKPIVRELPETRIVVQPRNCGTANGILLASLWLETQDPNARVLFLPADHYIHYETVLDRALRSALRKLESHSELLMIGIEAEVADADLGYILPAVGSEVAGVARFVEKPSLGAAQALIQSGAVWNSFMFAARLSSLLALFDTHHSQLVMDLRDALQSCTGRSWRRNLERLYTTLPLLDFSKDILQGSEDRLRVLIAPPCGWTDLGTPHRVVEARRRFRPLPSARRDDAPTRVPSLIDLVERRIVLQ
jgi:mannose-1-phosphate guanylyltransferase